MNNRGKKKERLLATTLLAGLTAAIATGPAVAQDTDPAAEEEEAIVVTGSRIQRSTFNLTQPSVVVDNEYITVRGQTNAANAVFDVPGVFVGASPIITGNTGGASAGIGQNIPSIFGLGSQRTLSLIDGRRFVSSNAPAGGAANAGVQVDLNNIPLSMIERVEIVKVGGAAVYGADAVAGVVNYILRDDFQGAELSGDYRSFGESGYGEESSIRGIIGSDILDGRGNLVAALEYNRTDNITADQVPQRADSWTLQTPIVSERVLINGAWPSYQVRLYPQPRAGILSFSGLISPVTPAVSNVGLGSWPAGGTCNPAAGVTATCDFIQFSPTGDGSVVAYDPGRPTGNTIWSSGGDGLNLIPVNSAREGYERYNLSVFGNYKLTDWLNFSAQIFANHYRAENPGYQPPYSSGAFGGTSAALLFPTSHPLLSASARAAIESRLGGPGNFYVHRGWRDLSSRSILNENDVEALTFALDGDFGLGDRTFNWEISWQQGETRIFSRQMDVQPHRWFAAMDVGTNPNTGQLDCRFNYTAGYETPLLPTAFGVTSNAPTILGQKGSCVPFDPFGTPSQAAIDYLSIPITSYSRITQEIFGGYISGDLFELPAGPLGVAVGFERRHEYSETIPDGGNEAGLSVLTGGAPVSGGYTTRDVYGEVHVPIISPNMNFPLVREFEMEASARNIDNSRSGGATVWAVGANWRPFDDIMFRYNRSQTVRAPAVAELFAPRTETFSFAADPCDQRNVGGGPAPATRRANCIAEGINVDTFLSLAVNASRGGFTGGNPTLTNEEAEAVNYGVVITPSFIEGLAVSVDFTRIEIEDAIVNFTLTNIMQACYDATNYPNQFCTMFTRLPNFQLPDRQAFNSGFVNAALREFDTVELAIRYNRDVADLLLIGPAMSGLFGGADLGTLDFNARLYNVQTNTTSNTGFDFTDTVGQFDDPEWRGDFRIVHELDRLTTFLDIIYTGEGQRNNFGRPGQYIDLDGTEFTSLPSYTTVDVGFQLDITDSFALRGRVQNALDFYPNRRQLNAGIWNWGRIYNVGFTARF